MSKLSTDPTLIVKIASVIGGLFLVGLVGSAWFPQPCSYLRQSISSCPRTFIGVEPPAIHELNRVPHTDIVTGNAIFTTKAQDKRAKTVVDFEYHADYTAQNAFLEINDGTSYKQLGLITSPLLTGLDWPRNIDTDAGLTLYQRGDDYENLDKLFANLPPASTLAADAPAARLYGLKDGQYTPLEGLTDLTTINVIVTTYAPPQSDGTWKMYVHQFNLSTIPAQKDGTLAWRITAPKPSETALDFLLGQVHIDYRDDRFP